MESSSERSDSLDILVLTEPSIDDVSVLAPAMPESFGVEARPAGS
jgi:hypothetical protein